MHSRTSSSISTINGHTSLADCCPLGLPMLQSKLSGFTSELDAAGQQMEVACTAIGRKQCTEHLSLTNMPVLQKPTLACVAKQAIWLLIQVEATGLMEVACTAKRRKQGLTF